MPLNANLLKKTENQHQEKINECVLAPTMDSSIQDNDISLSSPNLIPNASASDSGIKMASKGGTNALQENKNSSIEAMLLKKAKNAGTSAGRNGFDCPTKEVLEIRKYSPKQIEVYLNAYNANTCSLEERQIRRAKSAGANSASHGCKRPTEEQLQERNSYSPAQIKAYLNEYDRKTRSLRRRQMPKAKDAGINAAQQDSNSLNEALLLKKAAASGSSAALRGYNRPTKERLRDRNNYLPAQIEAYLNGYDKKVKSLKKQQIQKAKDAGANAARQTSTPPTEKMLQEKNKYTLEQIEAYFKAYDEAKARILLQQNNILLNESYNLKEKDSINDKHQKGCKNKTINSCVSSYEDLSGFSDFSDLLQKHEVPSLFLERNESFINNYQNNNLNYIESFNHDLGNQNYIFEPDVASIQHHFHVVNGTQYDVNPVPSLNNVDYSFSNFYGESFLDLLFNEQETYLPEIYSDPSFESKISLEQRETNLSGGNTYQKIAKDQNIDMCMSIPNDFVLRQYDDINTFDIQAKGFTSNKQNNFDSFFEPTEMSVQKPDNVINNAQCEVTPVSSSNSIHHAFTRFRKKPDSNLLFELNTSDTSSGPSFEKKTSFSF